MITVLSIPDESVHAAALRAVNTAFESGRAVVLERFSTTCVIQPTDSVQTAEASYHAAILAGNHATMGKAGHP